MADTCTPASDINLGIPVGTRLSLNLSDQKDPFVTELIGFSSSEYLILRMPRLPGLRASLIPGETLAVRYILQGTVYGFISQVITSIIKPGSLLFCSYPSSVEQIELRGHHRLNCLLPATASAPQGKYHCILQDLSQGGAKLVFKTEMSGMMRQLAVGTELMLDFALFTAKNDTPVSAAVRSMSIEGHKVNLGIQFQNLPEQLRNEMEMYLDAVQDLC